MLPAWTEARETFCYPAVYVLSRLGLGRRLMLLGLVTLLPLWLGMAA